MKSHVLALAALAAIGFSGAAFAEEAHADPPAKSVASESTDARQKERARPIRAPSKLLPHSPGSPAGYPHSPELLERLEYFKRALLIVCLIVC